MAYSLWKKGIKDIGLVCGLSSAVLAYFTVFDIFRGRDPEHKKALYEKRKAAWQESQSRPIIGLLKQQAERLGGMDRLKNPQIGQQLMMQFVQAGERALAGQDLLTATKYFTYGVDLSYFSQGEAAAIKLIQTIGGMLPQITGQIQADFEKDKKAIDRMNAELAKPLKSRDEMIKSLKADLEVDPIDESDEEDEPQIREVVEEEVLEEDPIDEDEPVAAPAQPEEVTSAEEITSAEVLEATEETEQEKQPEQIQPTDQSEESEETGQLDEAPQSEPVVQSEASDQLEEEPQSEPVVQSPVPIESGETGQSESSPGAEETADPDVGDAPAITKTTIASEQPAVEMEDEELE